MIGFADDPVGRDLDLRIALRVMGWRYYPRFPDDAEGYLITPTRRIIYEDWPAFTADVSAAWLVVQRLNQLDPPWRVELVQLGYPPTRWRCTVFQDTMLSGTTAYADTLPLALCRAALHVVPIDTPAHYRVE